MRTSNFIFYIPMLFILLGSNILEAKPFPDADCQECHGEKGFSTPVGEHGYTEKKQLYIDTDFLKGSVHGDYQCTDCHTDIEEVPHRKGRLEAVDCISCHEKLKDEGTLASKRRNSLLGGPPPKRVVTYTEDYQVSAHNDTSVNNNARCATCHTAHYVYPTEDSRANTHRLNPPEV